MTDKHCLICGKKTSTPLASMWLHLKPYEENGFKYFKGNRDMFGTWSAITSCIYLTSPLISTIRHWKTRKMSLDFGSDPMVLHALAIEGEKITKKGEQ